MTLAVLILIVAIAGCFAALTWRRTSKTLLGASILLLFAVGCGPIPQWLLGGLQSPYVAKPTIEWAKRNAIVVLGAGTEKIAGTNAVEPGTFAYARLVQTVALYRDCRLTSASCRIVVSGGDARNNGLPEAPVYRDALIRIGVDANDILLESKSMNTWQNAQFTSAILRAHDTERVLLVSSGIHVRRSALYFAHFGIAATPVRADYLAAIPSWLPLAYNFAVADFALHEYIGIARYHAYNALGWNAARTLPGEA